MIFSWKDNWTDWLISDTKLGRACGKENLLINDNDDGETYKVHKKYSKRKKYYTTWNILGVFITFDSRQSLHVSFRLAFPQQFLIYRVVMVYIRLWRC